MGVNKTSNVNISNLPSIIAKANIPFPNGVTLSYVCETSPRPGPKLFNRDSYTTTLVPSLALKTNKPVVFVSLNLNVNKKLEVNLINSNSDIYNDSKHQLSMNKDIEKLININASDYSWEYKRFKKPPTGIINPYLNI